MSVVVLAEVGGQVWLVRGEEHVDDLMYNQLSPDVAVEWVACETRADAFRMWQEMSDGTRPDGMPWLINPMVVSRIRAASGTLERLLRFSPWSAMLDEGTQRELAGAAEWLGANPGGRLVLRYLVPAAPAPGQADLQRLRLQLVTGALQRSGVAAEALTEEAAPANADGDADRMEIVTVPPNGGA